MLIKRVRKSDQNLEVEKKCRKYAGDAATIRTKESPICTLTSNQTLEKGKKEN